MTDLVPRLGRPTAPELPVTLDMPGKVADFLLGVNGCTDVPEAVLSAEVGHVASVVQTHVVPGWVIRVQGEVRPAGLRVDGPVP